MIGVVLWADREVSRAVVWCADHGRLAYYDNEKHADVIGEAAMATCPPTMDAGDVIRFDLHEDAPRRIVSNPRVVHEAGYQGLVDSLGVPEEAQPTDETTHEAAMTGALSSNHDAPPSMPSALVLSFAARG